MNDMGAFLKNMFQPRKQKGTHISNQSLNPIVALSGYHDLALRYPMFWFEFSITQLSLIA